MQLARNLTVEWGHANIRVNCIAPGLVRTDFARALWDVSSPAGHWSSMAETPSEAVAIPEHPN